MIIIDASVFIAGILPDERHVDAAMLLDAIVEDDVQALVPPLFCHEVGNACLMAHRRKRLDSQSLRECLTALSDFPAAVDVETRLLQQGTLANTHQLTFYDAAYLELAERHQSPLATLDKSLLNAAGSLDLAYQWP